MFKLVFSVVQCRYRVLHPADVGNPGADNDLNRVKYGIQPQVHPKHTTFRYTKRATWTTGCWPGFELPTLRQDNTFTGGSLMSQQSEKVDIEPIPAMRRWAFDAGYLGRRAHIVHGLLEIDVSDARTIIRHHRQTTGEKLSFTAFIINCLGQAVTSNPHVHAYRDWRNRLIIFENVNINSMIEAEMNGRKAPMPHIFKAVNKRSFRQINDELRTAQTRPGKTMEADFMRWFLRLPTFLRRLFYRIVLRFPRSLRQYSSPITVTAVGMFGKGSAWGIPMASFTLTVTLGTIARKPAVFDDQIQIRDILHMTVSIDHDIVDGAPAARFMNELRQLIESAYGLPGTEQK